MMNNLMARIGADCCRITMDGETAVKTSNGYKVFDMKTKRLTNVNSFCFDVNMGMDMFFAIPTTNVQTGDIIMVDGKPKCVLENKNNEKIEVVDYETNEIKTFVPERQLFMGNFYFYSKIVNVFGKGFGKGGSKNIMKMMLISNMMNRKGGSDMAGSIGNMMMMSMLMGNKDGMFNGLFDELDSDNVLGSIDPDDIVCTDSKSTGKED